MTSQKTGVFVFVLCISSDDEVYLYIYQTNKLMATCRAFSNAKFS